MKIKSALIIAIGLILELSSFAKEFVPVDDGVSRPENLVSLSQVEEVYAAAVRQFLPIVPPDVSRRYIYSPRMVYSAEWLNGDFPTALKRQLVAELCEPFAFA